MSHTIDFQKNNTRIYRSALRVPVWPSKEMAYFLAMLIGDGSVGAVNRPTIYLVGDLVDERIFYDSVIVPLIRNLFQIRPYCYIRKGKQAYALHFKSRKLVEYLIDKVEFPVGGSQKFVPSIITKASEGIKTSFLRGILDSDGSLVLSRKTYDENCYPSIEIKSVSQSLTRSVNQMLVEAGFRVSIGRSQESWVVRLNGREMLERWMKKIGTWNIKHQTKYLVWKKTGSCPAGTTMPMRLQLIGGSIETLGPELKYPGTADLALC